MTHRFQLKIDPVTLTGQVFLDQHPMPPRSPLCVCGTRSFFDWYLDLPKLLFSEINDDYSLCVEGPELTMNLLRAAFRAAHECIALTHVLKNMRYSMELRLKWLKDAASVLNVALPAPPKFSVLDGTDPANACSGVVARLPAAYRDLCQKTPSRVNIWLNAPGGTARASDLVLCSGSDREEILPSGAPLLNRDADRWPELIADWVDRMILAPYLFSCQGLLSPHMNKGAFVTKAQLYMLTRDEPWVEIQPPARMELGTTGPIRMQEFPSSKLQLAFSDKDVLSNRGAELYAAKVGKSDVIVLSESGAELRKRSVQVYRVNRVTSISLRTSHTDLLMDETFAVTASFVPTNADNLSKAVWTVAPGGVITHLGGGRFRATAPGHCRICLTVESVSQQIDVNVHPVPTAVQMPAEIRVKLNNAPAPCQTTLLPADSRCQMLRYRIADPAIAAWDPGSGAVRPVAEGKTELEVSAIGANGVCLFTRKCPVTVLPEKTIVTLPTLLTLAVCCAILFLLAYYAGSPAYILLLYAAVGFAVVSAIIDVIAWVRHRTAAGVKLSLLLSTLVITLCIYYLVPIIPD